MIHKPFITVEEALNARRDRLAETFACAILSNPNAISFCIDPNKPGVVYSFSQVAYMIADDFMAQPSKSKP